MIQVQKLQILGSALQLEGFLKGLHFFLRPVPTNKWEAPVCALTVTADQPAQVQAQGPARRPAVGKERGGGTGSPGTARARRGSTPRK